MSEAQPNIEPTITDGKNSTPRTRAPMSAAQRAKLSAAQFAYMANDPRWPEHRRKLAAAQEARRMTLFPNEVQAIVRMRAKGRTFSSVTTSARRHDFPAQVASSAVRANAPKRLVPPLTTRTW